MLYIEIADNPESHHKGLMFRKSLEDNHGMLFKFSRPQILNFWGLNTYIPLDVAFVSEDNKIIKISKISPLSTKAVGSDKDCVIAIEANDGYFGQNQIKIGDKISIKKDDLGYPMVHFEKGEKEIS